MKLTRFDKDGIELIIDTTTGESFASKRGYARMANKDEATIRKRLKGVDLNKVKRAEIPTAGGLQGADLITEDLIAEWLPKDNPTLATQLMKIGVRAFLHQLAGYQISSTATDRKMNSLDVLVGVATELRDQSYRLNAVESELSIIDNKLAFLNEQAYENFINAQELARLDDILAKQTATLKAHESELKRIFRPDGDYYSIRGYASNQNLKIALHQAISLGKQAANLSRKKGVPIDFVKDPRYGAVNIYHESILQQLDWR